MIPMELSRIIISETNEEQIIVLKEIDGHRFFPILIGLWEAIAIDRNIKQKKAPRPMTHDLIESVIKGFKGKLDRVIVSDLKEHTFYARLIIRRNGEQIEVDSRPSDAIALAVQMQVPIFVEESVLTAVAKEDGASKGEGGDEESGDEGGEHRKKK